MIHAEYFLDELEKIAQAKEDPEGVATRERAARALRTAALYGAGSGLGAGTGLLAASAVSPLVRKLSLRNKALLATGAAATGAALGGIRSLIVGETLRKDLYGKDKGR